MGKAAILAVDDDRVVLNSVDRDLRQKYGRAYRILKAESGAAALAAVNELKKRGEDVALFVADQRMPEMTGVQFLEQALAIFPTARKVLLTAYADTEAAIQSINKIGLDYYLMKPWDPPEEHFYPVLDGILDEWQANDSRSNEGMRIIGTLWSSASHETKDFLARNSIPYQWLDLENNPEARRLLEAAAIDGLQLPVIFFADGSFLVEPSTQRIAEKVGLPTKARNPFYDVIIIGAGPAGLSAAVYASADGL
jgi:thioredoxin reductase (NADPH)